MKDGSCSSSTTTIGEVLHRREDRAPHAHADPRLAAAEPLPLGVPLGGREAGVEERDLVAEARAEAPRELRRERDLGHEHERALRRGARARDRLEVDLGLAGAGDAVEEEGRERPERAVDRLERRGLRGREAGARGGGREEPAARDRGLALDPDEAAPRERGEGRAAAGNAARSSSTGMRPRASRYSSTARCARARGERRSASAAPGSGAAYSTPRRAGRRGAPPRVEPGRQRRPEQLAGGTR